MIARDFSTFDVDDLDFEIARNAVFNAAYHVYDGLVSIQSGGNEYEEFFVPMLASSVQIGLAISSALVFSLI